MPGCTCTSVFLEPEELACHGCGMMFGAMDFDDPEWTRLAGGYRVPYDPRAALRALEKGDAAAWTELWNELHHQGDVGEASYAAVPHLVRIHEARGLPEENTYAMVATIDDERRNVANPDLPANLATAYHAAWQRLVEIGIKELQTANDPLLVSSIISVIAIGKGQPALGWIAVRYPEDERRLMLAKYEGLE